MPLPQSSTVAPQVKPAPNAPSSTRSPASRRPFALAVGERQRQRRRRRVAVLADAVDDAVGGEAEPLADGG